MMMKTQISINLVDEYNGPLLVNEETIKKIATLILSEELDPGFYSVSIINCTDNRIQALNKIYRQVDEPTDVLTFPMESDDINEEPFELGDIFLSIDTIKTQSTKWENTPQQEYIFMLIHGLLHICGWEHVGPYNEKEEMFQRQRHYFDQIRDTINFTESTDNPSV